MSRRVNGSNRKNDGLQQESSLSRGKLSANWSSSLGDIPEGHRDDLVHSDLNENSVSNMYKEECEYSKPKCNKSVSLPMTNLNNSPVVNKRKKNRRSSSTEGTSVRSRQSSRISAAVIPDNSELTVYFGDLDRSKTLKVLETDTIALLMDDIIATGMFLDDTIQIYQLEFLVDGVPVTIADWNKNISEVIESTTSVLKVNLRKKSKPPFLNMSQLDVWNLCTEMRKSYQLRLKREKKLRNVGANLNLILRDVPKPFREVFIEAVNAKDDAMVTEGSHNERSYTAHNLHLIVVYCFQDFLSKETAREQFIKAVLAVVLKARGTNQKLNALRILSEWIRNFRGRDFSPKQSINFIDEYYKPILQQFEIDDDFKTLPNFQMIREDLPSVAELKENNTQSWNIPKNITVPPKSTQFRVRADFIYLKCLEIFKTLSAGDFANCKHKSRRMKEPIKALTNFTNKTSLVVAYDILQKDNASQRGQRIDEWIMVAECLLVRTSDYHSAVGVVAGLTLSPIYRLKKSWEFAKEGLRLKKVQDRLSKNNYSDLRAALVNSFDSADDDAYGQMVIPFLGMIQKDLEKVDQIPNVQDDESINKWKYHLVSKCVTKVIGQLNFKTKITVKYKGIFEELEELYKDVEDIEQANGSYPDLDDLADEHVKCEKGKVLCNQGVRSKLVTSTFMNIITWGALWYMLYTYLRARKRVYTGWHIILFFAGNVISCWVTHVTTFEEEMDKDFDKLNWESKERNGCSSARIFSYLYDIIGLGILPAFWRAWEANRMFENIYGHIDSWKKEFSLQCATASLGSYLPLVVFFLYTNFRSLEITHVEKLLVLIFPVVSISWSIFHMFRGAHQTIFLVSGRTIVLAGFISLGTDFLLRVFPWVGFFSYLIRVSSCDNLSFLCVDLLADYGETYCDLDLNITFPNGGTMGSNCCECDGGKVATYSESHMYKGLASLMLIFVLLYEISWVFFFHWRYEKHEAEHRRGKIDTQIANWKRYLIMIGQGIGLSVTFLMVNFPILGMYRPRYRHLEHFTRVLMSIAFGVLFIIFDKLLENSTLLIWMCTVIPIHGLAYMQFERAFAQQETMPRSFGSLSKDQSVNFTSLKFFADEGEGKLNVKSPASDAHQEEKDGEACVKNPSVHDIAMTCLNIFDETTKDAKWEEVRKTEESSEHSVETTAGESLLALDRRSSNTLRVILTDSDSKI